MLGATGRNRAALKRLSSLERSIGLPGHALAQLAECCLGLRAGEAVDVSLGVHEPEPALDLAAAGAPLRDPGVAVGAGAADERTAAVPGASRWVRATAARFASEVPIVAHILPRRCTTRCTTLAETRLNSRQLPTTQKQ